MLSAVAAETVEKAAEVPRAEGGGGGGRWRGGRASSEWSSPAGLSRAHRRELRMGEGGRRQERGKACNGSTILVRSFAQSFCMPARFHARGTRVLARRGMRLDDGGCCDYSPRGYDSRKSSSLSTKKKSVAFNIFFFLNPFLSAFLLFSSRVVSRARSNVETREELKINLIDTFPRGFSREEHAIRR